MELQQLLGLEVNFLPVRQNVGTQAKCAASGRSDTGSSSTPGKSADNATED